MEAREEVMRLLEVLSDPKKSKERLVEIDKRASAVEARETKANQHETRLNDREKQIA